MITGEIKSQVDKVWNAFWTGGISNPLEVIEQITYLLFLKRLDENQTRAENKANRTGKPVENPVFPSGLDGKGRSYQDFRWSKFKNFSRDEMYTVFAEHIFPFLRTGLVQLANGEESSYAQHMKDARFTIPNAGLLEKVVDIIDEIPMDERDTKGDLYEYMLGKIASAGTNGQFRTPRHIIDLMVKMTAPQPMEAICDPAAGTAGFLVQTGEYLRQHNPNLLTSPEQSKFFHHSQFHGYDFDSTMLRIGSMNMLLHGVENPDITHRDSLADLHGSEEEKYDVILANPPFAGSLDYENVAKDLLSLVKTKKTELLFLALFLRLLKPGGRAAVIVPDGVMFGSSAAHKALRKMLVEDHKLDGVVKLPSGVFKPYAGVSTAILFFTKTNSGGTDNVWFYDVTSDGFSLDDKRTPLEASDLDDLLARWQQRTTKEAERARTDQSFLVTKAEIAGKGYDLSLNRYKEVEHQEIEHKEPALIDAFARTEDSPHIAVSVDMLDAGIDVPEVVNLLFFKVVRSKTKFWQMVGRGTRLRPELYGPGEDKQDFFIFDVCQNVEYFNAELPGSEGSLGQSLAQRSFAVRAQLLAEARTVGLDGDFVPTLQSGLVGQVAGLPRENFLVRPQLQWVEKFSKPASWGTIGTQDLTDLQTKLAPLATLASAADTEEAKRFDLLMYQAQLASLASAAAVEPYRKKIVEIASALQDQPNIPAIAAQMLLIQSILEGGEWGQVSPQWLELIRVRLRGLVHLIEKKRRKVVYTNFEDTLGEIVEGELKGTVTGSVDLARYREKARMYLQGFLDHMAIHRLRRGLPLTETDLAELQRMLIESGAGSPEELEAATRQAEGLGLFVRSLVGMDRQAALDSLSEFVGNKTLNANQLHFVDMIVQQLTENGVVDVGALYESPYSDAAPAGPESLFPESDVDLLAEALNRVRVSAMVG